ncbi:cytochrome P450 [Streptomyces antnestii]|uniref:Cytochrome P450 n=1 Tax=Streptomyces antnestii TaxID=2494256 RepID=A0A437Q3I8_9ACTN|nr:cytochrome P450 [Streptomyces sp. San01]RVU29035.1 cytochrome P450 [Streptomyces sp. San01]
MWADATSRPSAAALPRTGGVPIPAGGTEQLGDEHGPERVDLFDRRFVADPFPTLMALRGAAPVYRDPGTGLWLVSRYADVREILLDPSTYRPDNAQNVVARLSVPALRVLAAAGFTLPPALANNGGPSHFPIRRLVSRFFNSDQVSAAAPLIEKTAEELLTAVRHVLERGEVCDLVTAFARPLPCHVMMRMLGIENMPATTLQGWSDAALELFYGRPSADRQLELATQVADFYRWLSGLVADAPEGGLMGALRRHRLPDAEKLGDSTVVAVCFFVFVAGHSTTALLISTLLHRALTEPGLWSRVSDEADVAEGWVEEVLRREPPVTSWRRVTTGPVTLSGVDVPPDAPLLLMLMGSGSDPEVFADPERMCPGRANVRHHLAFGVGRHRCPGASLARTEAALALRAAARRLPQARLAMADAEPPMLGLLSFRGPLQVVVAPH